jgi:tetratricopeptide (TPR) repeat protein
MDLSAQGWDTATALNRGLRLHAEGRPAEAEAIYREVLAHEPDHPRALGMLALILADGPDPATAEAALRRHLTLEPRSASSLLALGRLRAAAGDDLEAADLLGRAAAQRPDLSPIHNDLGVALFELARHEDALAAFDRAVAADPDHAPSHANRARTLVALKRLAEAEAPARQALRLGGADADGVERLAAILDGLKRPDEATALRDALSRRAGLQMSGRTDPGAPVVLMLGAVGGGHVPTRYLLDTETFAVGSLSLLSPAQADAPLGAVTHAQLAAAEVVFCALGDIDRDRFGQLATAEALLAELGKPVLNPPARIRQTGRENAAVLFDGVDGLVAPPVTRASPAELAALPLTAPMLVRPAGDHGGENLVLLRNPADRAAYLASEPPERLLVTPYVETRSPDGFWRKYRLIFVGGEVFAFHLAITEDWLAHYWRAHPAQHAWKRAEEAEFLADWRAVFGPRRTGAVQAVCDRLGLDYGGIDCAITGDEERGDDQVVLFEANACVLLHLDEPAAMFPYKHRHVPPIRKAFSRLLLSRAGRPS